ncbi:MAG: hypothetical protein M0015_05890 [Betaproteobacteria bacterium]|nr:hypothetical protein [Betaproteobacteria bacterium]
MTVLRFRAPERTATPEPAFQSWAPPEVIAWHREERWRAESREAELERALAATRAAPVFEEKGAEERDAAVRALLLRRRREDPHEIARLLERLLTDARMVHVWGELVRCGNFGAGAGVPYVVLFTAEVIRAWRGPRGLEQLTPAERAARTARIVGLCSELEREVRGTSDDEYLWRIYFHSAPALERGVWHPGGVCDLLWGFASWVARAPEAAPLKGPGDGKVSRRAYFVRRLGAWLREAFGGPRARWIALTAAVALQDQAIDEHTVRRLLRARGARSPRKEA